MNKQDWTYKKLGEVATFVNGYPFKPTDWKDYGRKIIRIQNLNNPNAAYNFYDGSIDPKYLVSNGDVLISWSGSLGVFEWTEDEAILNQHIFKVVFNKGHINKRFFEYVVASRINEMKSKVHGVTMQHITKKEFDVILIPVPPIAEQERIVAELDLLSGIIEKKKEQLKAYDQLAQSIFYTMFGDPIDNPKGWETKKMGEGLSYIKNGANIKQTKGASGIPITRIETLSGGVFNRDRLGYADILSTDKYGQYVMEDMDILMSHINSKAYIGRAVVYRKEGDETIIHGMNLLRLKVIPSLLSSVYLDFFFKSDYFKDRVARIRKDAVNQSSMAISDLVKIPICVPPLSLQEEFAEKIEAIERQKALVQQSIEETQTMFDCTMDKYFG